ncbi:MAG: amino acid permease [Fervidicoccaceae archaeon]
MSKRKQTLLRSLGFLHTFFIGLGAIIGGSIVVLIGPTIAASGTTGAFLTLIFSSLIATITALVYTEITSVIPEVGGGYLWAKLTMPRPFPFFAGWVNWLAHTLGGTFYALSFSVMLTQFLQDIGLTFPIGTYAIERIMAIGLIVLFGYLNYSGIARVGWFSVIIGIFFVIVIVFYGVYGTYMGVVTGKLFSAVTDSVRFTNIPSIFIAMITVVIAFEGYEILAQTAEEAKSPLKNLPKAVLSTLLVATTLYVLVTISTMGILGEKSYDLSLLFGDRTVMVAASLAFKYGGPLVALGGLATILSSINSTMFSSSRVLLAMARAGEFPKFFADIHEKYRTPSNAIIFTTIMMSIASLFMDVLISAFVVGILFNLLFIIVNYSGIKLRIMYESKLNYGFKTPLFPLIPLIGLVTKMFFSFAAVIFNPIATLITLGLIAFGFFLYKGFIFKYEVEHELPLVTGHGSLLRKDYRIMVLYPSDKRMGLIQVASHIAREKEGELNIVHLIEVPQQTPLSSGAKLIERDARPLKDITDHLNEIGIPTRYLIRVTHSMQDALLATLEGEKIDLLIADLKDAVRLAARIDTPTGRKITGEPISSCDLILVNMDYPPVSYTRAKKIIILTEEKDKNIKERITEIFPDKEVTHRLVDPDDRAEILNIIEEIKSHEGEVSVVAFSYSVWKAVRRYRKRMLFPFIIFKRGTMSIEEFKHLFTGWR